MIVSDATILITLINIDEFRVLKLFVDKIIIPYEVYNEVSQKLSAKNFIDKEKALGFIDFQEYQDKTIFNQINYILDAGESASITLALEKNLPLIIDEKKGRQFAQKQGVEIIGLVGILRFLYGNNQLSKKETLNIVEKLNLSDFRISSSLLGLIFS